MRRLHFDEAEQALLGAVILVGEKAFDAAAVEPGDLFNLRHKEIWRVMGALREAGQPPGDIQLLEAALEEKLDQIGGLVYLAELTHHTVPDHVAEYSTLIRKAALTRRVQLALSELSASDLEGAELLAEVLDRARGLTSDIDDPARTMAEVAKETAKELADALQRKEAGEGVWGLSTGFSDLDEMLGGIQRGVVTILAGRPSMGKSALARSIAAHVVNCGIGAHVFTPEDSRRTYGLRQIADEGQIPLDRFQSLRMHLGDLETVQRVVGKLQQHERWLIDDTASISAGEIGLRVRKHSSDLETGLAVVDFGQLLRERDVPIHELRLQIEISTKRLVELARTENIAVLLLSQLSRACENRPDKRPVLSDLRESGNLEADAFAVMCLYRDDAYNPDSDDPGVIEVLVRKNKNGKTGRVKLRWQAELATCRPLSLREEPTQGSWA